MDEVIELSSWNDRLWAWLIDVLLMGILWHRVVIVLKVDAISISGVLLLAAILFIYWTALEGYRGQSLGKMLLNIVVTGPLGESIRFSDAAIEAFGKAFLLPIDCLIGWFAHRKARQRLFNRISDTVVIRRPEHYG
ncbi:MAG: RDD family protein [Methanothrix sp.]|nr:RDD family protein [Methanothrix sp.]MDD4446655.1 RDD family protein [Methanothrix sp.]